MRRIEPQRYSELVAGRDHGSDRVGPDRQSHQHPELRKCTQQYSDFADDCGASGRRPGYADNGCEPNAQGANGRDMAHCRQLGATFTPPTQPNRVQSFGTEVPVGTTATALTWTGLKPGTYLLESGTHPSIQVPMGLYGIVVVTTPAVPPIRELDSGAGWYGLSRSDL